jgi:inosine-uridine nucleoside N-ribohydrolase/formylmethanofuran dehydrogenase subunit E
MDNILYICKKGTMKKVFLLLSCILFPLILGAHPWKPSHYVIIDTDGGVDDMKAITLMLASPDIRVLGIIASPGSLTADETYVKVRSLLNSFYHEGIEVGINRNVAFKSPMFPLALKTVWGAENNINPDMAPGSTELIGEILSREKSKISFICLGGMSTVAEANEKLSLFKQQVKEILWSGDGLKDTKGFNFNIDPSASRKILRGSIPVSVIRNPGNTLFYSNDLLVEMEGAGTIYSARISGFLKTEQADDHGYSKLAIDEMVPLYLQFPSLFKTDSAGRNVECLSSDITGLKNGLLKMLRGETVPKNQVMKVMPQDPDFYFDDLKPSVTEIIKRYGPDEWASGVLANELHRHLGVFAIIGVKMGIRAREYFDTGVDEFYVTSFAGSEPPLSCMNDGLQVSTGATPGHGLLTVRSDTTLSASATFRYLDHKIKLTLNPDIAGKIMAELKQINFVYGLDSNIYWELVRKNTIKYWLDLDRHEIFIIEEIPR